MRALQSAAFVAEGLAGGQSTAGGPHIIGTELELHINESGRVAHSSRSLAGVALSEVKGALQRAKFGGWPTHSHAIPNFT